MRNQQTIISWAEENGAGFDPESLNAHTFDSPAGAKEFIMRNLEAESRDLNAEIERGTGNIQDMFSRKEGSFSFRVGDHEYHVHFLNVPPEYKVSDDELFSTLEAYCNSGRTPSALGAMASRIAEQMHRAMQAELWKFIKALIRAIAGHRFDSRNQTAWREAKGIAAFMDEYEVQ